LLIDLSFEEGTLRIGSNAFSNCSELEKAAFPTSLIVIEEGASGCCSSLRQISFAAESQLHYIHSEPFSKYRLNEIVIPASIMEIDQSAFSDEVWRKCVSFEGQPLLVMADHFIFFG
jgi:hypothetical protein